MQFLNQFQTGQPYPATKSWRIRKKLADYEITGLAAERGGDAYEAFSGGVRKSLPGVE